MRKILPILTASLICIACPSFAVIKTQATSKHTTTTQPPPKTATEKKTKSAKKKHKHPKTSHSKIHTGNYKSTATVQPASIQPEPLKNTATHVPIENVPVEDATPTTPATENTVNAQKLSSNEITTPTAARNTNEVTHHFLWFSWNNADSNHHNANYPDYKLNKPVTNFAHQTIDNLHYSAYKFGGNRFDPQHGIYMLDCSSYVDHLLDKSSPQAYSTLAQWTGSYKPNTSQYYDFFSSLSASNNRPANWNKVEDSQKLQAGDILVFRYKNAHGGATGGHVMLVMDKAVVNSNVIQVKVADSANTGHSGDTRGEHSGIGIGTLLLRVNPLTGQPYAFAWRLNSPWNNRVNIAMGRPESA